MESTPNVTGSDFNHSLKRFASASINDREVEVEQVEEEEPEENLAQKLLDEKVPAHWFKVDDIEYEWYAAEGYYYKKVAEFKSGDSFGELALREEKGLGTRAATVKCMTRSHFATLTKEDYLGSLKRIDARLIMELTEFLMHIPCFKTQSKKALVLFTKFLKKVEFTRGQTVYSEGSYAKSIYIVWSGEFELSKKLPKGEAVISEQNLGNPLNSGSNQLRFMKRNILARRLPEIKDLPYKYRMSYLARGSLIGDDDVVARDNYSATCKCHSTTGTLYELSKEEFMKLQNSDQSWLKILEKIIRKQQIRQGAHLDGEPRNFEKEIKDMEEQVESVLISGSGSPKRSKKA